MFDCPRARGYVHPLTVLPCKHCAPCKAATRHIRQDVVCANGRLHYGNSWVSRSAEESNAGPLQKDAAAKDLAQSESKTALSKAAYRRPPHGMASAAQYGHLRRLCTETQNIRGQ
jgi:hypothetical protein